jgi:hypothetical protein
MKNILDTTTIFIMQYLNSQTTHKRVLLKNQLIMHIVGVLFVAFIIQIISSTLLIAHLKYLSLNHVLFNVLIAFIVEIDNTYY